MVAPLNKLNPERGLGGSIEKTNSPLKNPAKPVNIIYHAKTIDNHIKGKKSLIRARIFGVDDALKDTELPICYPLLPSVFNVVPEINDHVLILPSNPWNLGTIRFYVGPLKFDFGVGDESFEQSMLNFTS